MRTLVAIALFSCVSFGAANLFAAVVIDSANTFAEVNDGTNAVNNSSPNTSGDNILVTLTGGYSSETTTSATTLGNSASILASYDHQRGGNTNGFASGNYFFVISTNVDIPFWTSGSYANTAGVTYFQNLLYDATFGYDVYNVYGNFSQSGLLTAGHTYWWYGGAYTTTFSPDSGATAVGGASLTIVPETSSLIVWSILAVTLCGGCWCRKRRLASCGGKYSDVCHFRMLTMRCYFALLTLVVVFAPAFKASAAVVITSDLTYSSVYNGSVGVTSNPTNTGGTVAIATLPGYSSTTTSVLNSAVMAGIFDQFRGGDYLGYSVGQIITDFSVDADVAYTASGSFSGSGGRTDLAGYLYDVTLASYVLQSEQISEGVPVVFTLGGTAGNVVNILSGSLTGTLLAGHDYEWVGYAYTQAYPSADGGAVGSGSVSLTIGSGAVPEFSSVIVWSLLALTIGGAGWWQRARLAA